MIQVMMIQVMTISILKLLRRITTNPSVNILVGIIFLATGLIEAWREIEDLTIGAHHGAIVMTAMPSITGHIGILSCHSWKRSFKI
jgi:hypothetical protein